jgi:hypothetical protein
LKGDCLFVTLVELMEWEPFSIHLRLKTCV